MVDASLDVLEPLMLLLSLRFVFDIVLPEVVSLPLLVVLPEVVPVAELLLGEAFGPVVAVPVVPERVVSLLRVDVLGLPVVAVPVPVWPAVPALGPLMVELLLGEPEAPPWPLVPVPAPPWAKAPPHAIAAAAERARIWKVCLMHDSCCVVGCLRQGRRVSTGRFGNGCAIGTS